MQRISFGDTTEPQSVSVNLQHTYVVLGQPRAALEVAEHWRARAIELLLAEQRLSDAEQKRVAAPQSAKHEASDLLAVAERQCVTIVVFSQISTRQVLAWVVRGSCARNGRLPLHMKQLHLPSDESLTHLVELSRRTIGVKERRGKVKGCSASAAHTLDRGALGPPTVDETALKQAMARCRDLDVLTDDDDSASNTSLLRRCHELLITPLELFDGEPLLIVPDQDLYGLPFAALLDTGNFVVNKLLG